MVADGVHSLLAIALTFLAFRSIEAEPYLLAALAASVTDVDRFVFDPSIELGYVQGPIWAHRGVTHSVFLVLAVVAVLSLIGPWCPAALGAGSHVAFDLLTGGVRLFAPVSPVMVGISGGWLLFNVVGSLFAGGILVVAVLRMDAEACSVSVGDSTAIGDGRPPLSSPVTSVVSPVTEPSLQCLLCWMQRSIGRVVPFRAVSPVGAVRPRYAGELSCPFFRRGSVSHDGITQ